MAERFHSIQVRAEDAGEVASAIARRFRSLGWKVVRDPKGRGAPQGAGDPDGLRRFLMSTSDRGWVTILPSGSSESGPDSLVAFLARELDTVATWFERTREDESSEEKLTYEVYWKNKRIDRQDDPATVAAALAAAAQPSASGVPGVPTLPAPGVSAYPALIDHDLQSLGLFMPAGQRHPKLTVAELPRFYPKFAGDKAYLGRFKKLVTASDYPMLWGSYNMVWNPAAPEAERLESWGHLGFQREDGRSAAARLTHGDPAARRSAVEALASCSAEEARPGLQAALADDDAEVRLAAATVVANRPDKGLAQDLSDRLADEDVRVRAAAARALKDMGDALALEPLQEVAVQDEPEVRRAAVAALASIDLPAARATLVSISKKEKDPEARRWTAEGLGRAALPEFANDLVRLLGDKEPSVRGAAARAAAEAARRTPPAVAGKKLAKQTQNLIDAVRKAARKDKDEETRHAAIRALRLLAPADEEATDLAMQLYAEQVKRGDLRELAVRIPREAGFDLRDKRIAAALLKRLEKEPTADVIVALGNQADERVLEALKETFGALWPKNVPAPATPATAPVAAKPAKAKPAAKPSGPVASVVAAMLREARAALPYAFSRTDDPAVIPALLRVLELERARPVPADVSQAQADEPFRVQTCMGAMEILLQRIPKAKQADLEKLEERLAAWLADPEETAAAHVLKRVALMAYGQPTWKLQPAPVPVAPKAPAKAPAKVDPRAKKGAKPAAAAPAKPALPPMVPPLLPNKNVVAIVRPLLQDPRWPEAPMVLARQMGHKAAALFVSAITKSVDKEVRLAKKGGYSRRDSELVLAHRRGLVLALKELRDPQAVPALARLLALEALRAGKVERKTESSLLSVTVGALQTITGYKFGAEPQKWAEVAAGRVPQPEPVKKPAAAAPVKALPAKKPAAKKAPAKPAAKKKAAVAPKKKTGSARRPVKKAARVAKVKSKAKKPGRAARMVKALSKIVAFRGKKSGAKKVSQPRRMAAKAARRRA